MALCGGSGVESISISKAELLTHGLSTKQTMAACFFSFPEIQLVFVCVYLVGSEGKAYSFSPLIHILVNMDFKHTTDA